MSLKASLNPCHKKKMQVYLCTFDLDISCDRWKIRENELQFSFYIVVLATICMIDIFQGCFLRYNLYMVVV